MEHFKRPARGLEPLLLAVFVLLVLLAVLLAPAARAQAIDPTTGAQTVYGKGFSCSGKVAASSSTISSAAGGTAFSGYVPGCPINLAFTPTAFTGTCYLEESLDGSGTNWWTLTVGAAGTVVGMSQWVFSASSSKTFNVIVETQANVPLRVDCGAVNGAYTSGSLVAVFRQ